MVPAIGCFLSAEMIRDGGSLMACFLASNGSEYRLMFKLILEVKETGEWVRLGYELPVIAEILPYRYENHFIWEPFNCRELTWEHARIFIRQLMSYAEKKTIFVG